MGQYKLHLLLSEYLKRITVLSFSQRHQLWYLNISIIQILRCVCFFLAWGSQGVVGVGWVLLELKAVRDDVGEPDGSLDPKCCRSLGFLNLEELLIAF